MVIPRRDVAARVVLALLVVGCIAVISVWAVDDAVDQASIVIAAALFGPLVIPVRAARLRQPGRGHAG